MVLWVQGVCVDGVVGAGSVCRRCASAGVGGGCRLWWVRVKGVCVDSVLGEGAGNVYVLGEGAGSVCRRCGG